MMQLVTTLLSILCLVLAIPAILASAYLLLLTLLSGTPRVPARSGRHLRFDIIVPAHNEASIIQRTVVSLLKIDWPRDKFRVLVVADNCTDATATLAREAGAEVLERFNDQQRGKGYALSHAFQASLNANTADAVVVVDADAEVSPNLLEAFATRIEAGAQAVQAHYGVLNPMASWRTRLITIAKASFHIVRSRARERLGVSCGIRGNGWCVTHKLLRVVPYHAYSLTEDLEYGIDLGLAGYPVAYADEAHSDAEMVTSEQVASKQRSRWEDGRFQLIRTKTLLLLIAAIKKRSSVCLDLAMDLMVLPLSYVVLNIILLTIASTLVSFLQGHFSGWLWSGLVCIASLLLYVLRGWQLSHIGLQGLRDLARAPGFLIWKLLLIFRRNKSAEWVRTDRERP